MNYEGNSPDPAVNVPNANYRPTDLNAAVKKREAEEAQRLGLELRKRALELAVSTGRDWCSDDDTIIIAAQKYFDFLIGKRIDGKKAQE